MSNFLRNLAARSLGQLDVAHPRRPSRYEPVHGSDIQFTDAVADQDDVPDSTRDTAPRTEHQSSPEPTEHQPESRSPVSETRSSPQPRRPESGPSLRTNGDDAVPVPDPLEPSIGEDYARSAPVTGPADPSEWPEPTTSGYPAVYDVFSADELDLTPERERPPDSAGSPNIVSGPADEPDTGYLPSQPAARYYEREGPTVPGSRVPAVGISQDGTGRLGAPLPGASEDSFDAEPTSVQDRQSGPASRNLSSEPPSGFVHEPWSEARRLAAPRDDLPPIRVTIGRIDVRAVQPSKPPARTRPERPRPQLTLAEYLKQRSGGGR